MKLVSFKNIDIWLMDKKWLSYGPKTICPYLVIRTKFDSMTHSDGYFYFKDEWNYKKNIMNMAPGATT